MSRRTVAPILDGAALMPATWLLIASCTKRNGTRVGGAAHTHAQTSAHARADISTRAGVGVRAGVRMCACGCECVCERVRV
eukprot:1351723-Pleurochrysis_carterae.AAC.1